MEESRCMCISMGVCIYILVSSVSRRRWVCGFYVASYSTHLCLLVCLCCLRPVGLVDAQCVTMKSKAEYTRLAKEDGVRSLKRDKEEIPPESRWIIFLGDT